jgi:thioredoxin 1
MIIEFSKDNFEKEVILSSVPVLVDFWASWCGPCRMQGPIIDALADEFKDKAVKIGKVNVDEDNELAAKYNIMSIPSLIIFKGGAVKEEMRGVHQKEVLAEKLKKYI